MCQPVVGPTKVSGSGHSSIGAIVAAKSHVQYCTVQYSTCCSLCRRAWYLLKLTVTALLVVASHGLRVSPCAPPASRMLSAVVVFGGGRSSVVGVLGASWSVSRGWRAKGSPARLFVVMKSLRFVLLGAPPTTGWLFSPLLGTQD